MNIIRYLTIAALSIAFAHAESYTPPAFPSELHLTNGSILHGSRPERWSKDYVVVRFSGGVASIQYVNIAEPQRSTVVGMRDGEIEGDRKAKEDANRKEQEEYNAKIAAEKEAQRVQKYYEDLAASHNIAVGMPEDLVIRAIGRPDHVNASSGGRDQWVYPDGTYVYIEGNRVASWQARR